MLSAISIIEEKEEFYTEIYQPDKNIVDNNYILLQMPKKKLAKIFQLKKKARIWKSEEKIRYALLNSYVKAD